VDVVRSCRDDELPVVLQIINAAAEAYRGVIPHDQWHEPYMSAAELRREIELGVTILGYELNGFLVGVMGIQRVKDVELIRHAYVSPSHQRRGVGARLIEYLRARTMRQLLVGTWAAAHWAISFYERHGFTLVSVADTPTLLRTYWAIPERQLETSVVLANPPWKSDRNG
jgi:GNAT superfamily N-acetyltransferase